MSLPFAYVTKERHKVFLAYYHADDEFYRSSFEKQFSAYYTSKSVDLGEIDTELSTEYIRRLIRRNYLADASVVIVLAGPNTKYRKHVDWEISAGLEPYSGRSGLLGVLLPEFPVVGGRYDTDHLPPRLADNVISGYANVCKWAEIDGNPNRLTEYVNRSFAMRVQQDLVRNSRVQMARNTGP
jgi:hypothetical protein